MNNDTLRFEWEDSTDIGHYECTLFDGDKKIDRISFWDYSCDFKRKNDKKNGAYRPYAFEVSWCGGWSMHHGLSPCEPGTEREYGYHGTPEHTVDDVRRWCENWLADRYIGAYETMLEELDTARRRAEWFKTHGYGTRQPTKKRSEKRTKTYVVELNGINHELSRAKARSLVNRLIAELNDTEDYLSLKPGDTVYYVDREEGTIEEARIFSIYIKGEKVDEFYAEFPESDAFDEFDGKALGDSFFIDKSRAEDALKTH